MLSILLGALRCIVHTKQERYERDKSDTVIVISDITLGLSLALGGNLIGTERFGEWAA